MTGNSYKNQLITRCELCLRQTDLTRHHLIPGSLHSNKKVLKMFCREQMLSQVLWVCRSWHNQIHALFSEKELATRYHSKQQLLSSLELQTFVQWLSNKPNDFNASSVSWKKTKRR